MASRRASERRRKKQLCEQLRLQSEILCDSYDNAQRSGVVVNRMLLIILDIMGERLNDVTRQALASHFTDSAINRREARVELGGTGDRNTLYLDGAFRISDLAKRISWSEARTGQILEMEQQ
jgi:hypothetical protein